MVIDLQVISNGLNIRRKRKDESCKPKKIKLRLMYKKGLQEEN